MPLLTVNLGNPTGSADIATDTRIEIVAGTPPSSPEFPCPILTLCDAPALTKVCVPGGPFFINPTVWCTDPVAPKTWSVVKNLYRPHP